MKPAGKITYILHYAGNQVQQGMQQRNTVSSTQRRCKNHDEKTQQVVGYDVTYRYRGKDGTVRTSYKPGSTLPVKDGVVVATQPEGRSS